MRWESACTRIGVGALIVIFVLFQAECGRRQSKYPIFLLQLNAGSSAAFAAGSPVVQDCDRKVGRRDIERSL